MSILWSDIKKCEYCNDTTTIKDDGFFICDSCYEKENTITCIFTHEITFVHNTSMGDK